MTPKEKAKQLYDSFEDDLMEADVYFLETAKKRCALIAVNEIIDIFENIDDIQGWYYSYWESVKIEIEKIEIQKL
jgi:hypothetical protein